VIIFCIIISLLWIIPFSWAGDKEELTFEWRALVAEWNLTLERFQQISPQYQALRDFQQKLDKMGLMFDKGKIVEKPKSQEKKPELPKSEKK